MNDLFEAIKTRLSTPLFGYFGLAFVAFNWKPLFYVVAQDNDVLGRIQFFEANTSLHSLAVWPFLSSLTFAVLYPWVILVMAWLTVKPIELRDLLQAGTEHTLLMRRKQLEEARGRLLASAELELIERAKRDERLDEVQSEELRNKLRAEIDQLRSERDAVREDGALSSAHRKHKELMDIAGSYRARAKEVTTGSQEHSRFLQQAREIEEAAHRLIVQPTRKEAADGRGPPHDLSAAAQQPLAGDVRNARA